jgi:salicylate hydroxylase
LAGSARIIIAGAGIGGLTAALALARAGFGVTVLEAAPRLEEIGAGVQLSPNATRVLFGLGLASALERYAVAPEALRIMNARSGREIAAGPLGRRAAERYGAPFLVVHRSDLQRVLLEAVGAEPAADLRLGVRVVEFARRGEQILVMVRGANATLQFAGDALIGADGLWSRVRERLGLTIRPQFCGQAAWRALAPASAIGPALRAPATTLWLGPDAHVVHYPVRAGALINIVAIVREDWEAEGWSTPGDPALLRARVTRWAAPLRDLIAIPDAWNKWALHDHPPLPQWGTGPVTLLGDAAHAMRPFLAQGAAMAIEDAAVLARALAASQDISAGLRAYEQARRPRTARLQREAARTGRRYAMKGPLAAVRNLVLARMGGEKLLRRYDWIYGWEDDEQ